MNKLIVIIALAFLAAAATAQTTPSAPRTTTEYKSPEERAIHHTNRMTKRYGLDSIQSKRLLEINTTRLSQKMEFDKKEQLAKEERKAQHAARKANQESYMNDLRSMMTTEQFATFEKDVEQRKSKRKEKGRGQKAPVGE